MTMEQQQQQQRVAIPKNESFTSVTDVFFINVSEVGDAMMKDEKVSQSLQQQQQQQPVQIEEALSIKESIPPSATGVDLDSATTTTTSSSSSSSSSMKSVRFGTIDQRIYNRIVGDHPDVRVGPPITFSWEYGVLPSTPIDDYEQQKREQLSTAATTTSQRMLYNSNTGLRRLSSITRKNMLRTLFDISEDEIIAAEREVQIIHQQRIRSSTQSIASGIVESNFRRAGRKVRKSIGKVLMAMATLPLPNYSVPTSY